MRAVCLREHGGVEALKVEPDFPDPAAGPDQVVIRVRATSLNYHDVFTCQGMPGIKVPMPMVIGLDIAGDIVEIGPGVTGWRTGDSVLVNPLDPVSPENGLMGETVLGGTAEYCLVDAARLIPIPAGVGHAQAAALPVAYGTAHRMLFTQGGLEAGERILILGASGGVGSCCVLLARLAGAEIVACGSTPAKLDALKSWGADHVVNYAEVDFVKEVWRLYGKPHRRRHTGGVDMLVNFTGGDSWVPSLRALKRGGRLMTCGATAGYDPNTDIRYIWTFELKVLGSNSWAPDDLTRLLQLVREGKLHPVIDAVLPLEETAEGVRRLRDRETIGKIIIAP